MKRPHVRRRRTPVGAPPGTLNADPMSSPTRVTLIGYGPDELVESDAPTARELSDAAKRFPVLWINVDGLADLDRINEVGGIFGLHQLVLEDIVNVHQRPKVEEFDDRMFIVTRMVSGPQAESTEQISLFLGPNFILTFQEQAGDVFEPIRDRLRQNMGRIRKLGADYLAYALLDAAIDGFFPVLELKGEALEELESRVLANPERRHISTIHQMKRDLLELRRAVWPQREMINMLIRSDNGLVSDDTKLFLRDCYDHTIQLVDMLEIYREIASDLVDIYLSSLSNRMNEIMKVLTIMATIFIPLSFLTGLFGMNFDPDVSPFNMPELRWYFGYPLALALMAVVAGGLVYYFWRKGWIEPKD